MSIGLVLSGGGARGAYEVGVLKFLREKLAREVPVHFDVLCGTSVGAINACYLAATATEPEAGVRVLSDVWETMRFEDVVRFDLRQMVHLPKLFLSNLPFLHDRRDRLGGLLNTLPLERLVIDRLHWPGISAGLASGAFKALSVTTTDVLTGLTTIFIQSRDGVMPKWSSDLHTLARATTIRPEHALASAAIPILFPAVQVDGRFYCDGGVRQNTPLSPVLRLGASKILVVGLRHVPTEVPNAEPGSLERFPGVPFIAGKVLNALLLDHLDYDIDRLKRFNALLEGGRTVYGPDFDSKVNAVLEPMRKAAYRHVDVEVVRPSVDLGKIAADHARYGPFAKYGKSLIARYLRHSAVADDAVDADLLSYLLFDSAFCRDLIELGYRDAAAQADGIAALFTTSNSEEN